MHSSTTIARSLPSQMALLVEQLASYTKGAVISVIRFVSKSAATSIHLANPSDER